MVEMMLFKLKFSLQI